MNPSTVRAHAVRRILAEVLGRSLAGMKEALAIRPLKASLDQEREIAYRIRVELGVDVEQKVREAETVGDLIGFVERVTVRSAETV